MRILSFDIPPYYRMEYAKDTGEVKVFSESKYSKGKELSQYVKSNGYLSVKLSGKHHPIHCLVAKYLLGERPEGLVINHKDGNKLNNSVENLEYCSQADNVRHAVEQGLHVACNPERHGRYIHGRAVKDKLREYKREWARKKLNISPSNYLV